MITGKFLSSFLYFGEYGPKNDRNFDRPIMNLIFDRPKMTLIFDILGGGRPWSSVGIRGGPWSSVGVRGGPWSSVGDLLDPSLLTW